MVDFKPGDRVVTNAAYAKAFPRCASRTGVVQGEAWQGKAMRGMARQGEVEMGAYHYCEACGGGLNKPTLSDIRDDSYICDCGHDNELRGGAHAALCDYIEDLEARLHESGALPQENSWQTYVHSKLEPQSGITLEVLIDITIDRLKALQLSPLRVCDENAEALRHLIEARNVLVDREVSFS